MERALYNCVLSGLSLDGKQFFYVNPLEVNPDYAGIIPTHSHVLPVRPPWHGCACCPPNIARLLASLDRYVWHETTELLCCDLFISGTYALGSSQIRVQTGYPYDGRIQYIIEGSLEKKLALRIPGWSSHWQLAVNGKPWTGEIQNGYVILSDIQEYDCIELNLDMTPRRCYSHILVRENQGSVCLQRGPLVYCLEGIDHSQDLRTLRIAANGQLRILKKEPILDGIIPLEADGLVLQSEESLYSFAKPQASPTRLRFIPYYAWGNRGLTQMTVWIKEL
jgi:DUF1680 family protein